MDKPISNGLVIDNIKRAQLIHSIDGNSGQAKYIQVLFNVAKTISPLASDHGSSQLILDADLAKPKPADDLHPFPPIKTHSNLHL